MSVSIYDDDLLGDPGTIEEIVEDELEERNVGESNFFADEEAASDRGENAVPELQTEAQGVAVEPKKKRTVTNPQPKLNPQRLMGPRGIVALEDTFKDFQFHGKGFEKSDLNLMMKRLEHWAHRLFPKYTFDDCIKKIEWLGNKREVKTYLKRIRMGLIDTDEPIVQHEEINTIEAVEEPIDAFDALISQQLSELNSTQRAPPPLSSTMEPATSPQQLNKPLTLTEEQRERMQRNRLLAEQRKLERFKAMQIQPAENKVGEENAVEQGSISETSDVKLDDAVSEVAERTVLKHIETDQADVIKIHENLPQANNKLVEKICESLPTVSSTSNMVSSQPEQIIPMKQAEIKHIDENLIDVPDNTFLSDTQSGNSTENSKLENNGLAQDPTVDNEKEEIAEENLQMN